MRRWSNLTYFPIVHLLLFILVEPRLNVDIPSSSELIGLQNGTSLNITINLISSPLPTYIQWIFRQEDDIDNVIKSYNSSKGFTYTSYIFIWTINSTQFGYYISIATNNIGSFRRAFTVIQKGKYYFYILFLSQVLVDRTLPPFSWTSIFFHVNSILKLSIYHWMTYIQ